MGNIFRETRKTNEAVKNYQKTSIIEPNNPKYYVLRGLTPELIARPPLSTRDELMNIIKDNDWERAEIFLKKVFYENPENIVGHVEEFIELWCGVCTGLLEKAQTKKIGTNFSEDVRYD